MRAGRIRASSRPALAKNLGVLAGQALIGDDGGAGRGAVHRLVLEHLPGLLPLAEELGVARPNPVTVPSQVTISSSLLPSTSGNAGSSLPHTQRHCSDDEQRDRHGHQQGGAQADGQDRGGGERPHRLQQPTDPGGYLAFSDGQGAGRGRAGTGGAEPY